MARKAGHAVPLTSDGQLALDAPILSLVPLPPRRRYGLMLVGRRFILARGRWAPPRFPCSAGAQTGPCAGGSAGGGGTLHKLPRW